MPYSEDDPNTQSRSMTILAACLCAASIVYYVNNKFSDEAVSSTAPAAGKSSPRLNAAEFKIDAGGGRIAAVSLPRAERSLFEYADENH